MDNKLFEMIVQMLMKKGFSEKTAEQHAKIMIEDMATQNDPELN